MLPVLEGIIARRILLNFHADPEVVQNLVPSPLKVQTHHGNAVVGVCLIRLEKLRPRGMPEVMGLTSENMAHRVAVLHPVEDRWEPGVFIWRRDTDQKLVQWLGGRMFPGVHHGANFHVQEVPGSIGMYVRTEDGRASLAFASHNTPSIMRTSMFDDMADASEFFRKGDCGYSCSMRGDQLEGMQLKTLRWEMSPLDVDLKYSAFFSDESKFPAGSIEFDSGLIMRGIPHKWHELDDVPEMAGAYA